MKKVIAKTKNIENKLLISVIILSLIMSIAFFPGTRKIMILSEYVGKDYRSLVYDTSKYIYLSDVSYDASQSYVKAGNSLLLDKNGHSQLITLNVEKDKQQKFIKGISAWATSNLVYNLSDLRKEGIHCDRFTSYIGVDASRTDTYFNNGVTIYIYTSKDGSNWDQAHKTNTMKGESIAEYVDIDISEANYLRLYAYENGNTWYSHWYDEVVYANPLLTTKDYVKEDKTFDNVKTVEYYDSIIKQGKTNPEYEEALLKRKYVNSLGYDIIQAYMAFSEQYKETIDWLFSDKEALKTYILGGTPDGAYGTSFIVLNELYHKYKSDLQDSEHKDLYLKMLMSISLTHSAPVGLWVTGAPADPTDVNGSEAIDRYAIFKQLYLDNLLNNDIFENISVEEMRFVMNNIIDDEEIMWLNEFATLNGSTNPYTYITYRFGYEYNNEKYFNKANLDHYNKLVRNGLKVPYNFTKVYKDANGKEHSVSYGVENRAKLWIVFEEGGVCGALSKTGSNIQGSYGIPSTVVSQPGHAAYIYMQLDKNGNKVWTLYNDVSGWGQSGKTEKLSTRMMNGWGTGSYADYEGSFPASYMLLSQAALNDYENYEKAEMILLEAAAYEGNYEKLKSIYEEALKVQKINFDAWLGLVQLMVNKEGIASSELVELARRITTDLRYYPRGMYDLIKMIDAKTTSSDNAIVSNLLHNALLAASSATEENVLQPGPTKQVAQYLLNSNNSAIATFSFDGENGGMIRLAERFEGNGVTWEYSIDGGRNYKTVSETAVKLTDQELALINEETDIHVRIVGAQDVVYDIPINKGIFPPSVYNNDLENKIIGVTDKMEWKLGTDGSWSSYETSEPDLSGDKEVFVRIRNNGTTLASEPVKFTFTSDGEDVTKKYVSVSKLSVEAFSSDEPGHSNQAANIIDGNINTIWHTLWNGNDTEKYIVIGVENSVYLTALDYVPRQDASNGRVLNARISVSTDNKNWETIVDSTSWANNAATKRVSLSEPVLAKYIKVEGVETYGSYMSGAMINIYEDITKNPLPEGTITYSTKEFTNKDVVATLTVAEDVKIVNNEGKNTYTFTENGEFDFIIERNGRQNTVKAKVDWIDKVAPTAEIEYSTTTLTNQNVVAKLVKASKKITITSKDKSDTHIFTENGEYTFEYVDEYGNVGKTTASVNWIDKVLPQATLSYSATELTTSDVTVTLSANEEIVVTNNEGKNTYTFTENGEFTFTFKDLAGNEASITALVNWIIPDEGVLVNIEYSPNELTNQDVVATLVNPTNNITITNNEGKNTYTFTDNGEFTFEYVDDLGKKGTIIAKVDWIDKVAPTAEVSYSTKEHTIGTVTVWIPESDDYVVVNNDGLHTYTFTTNGTFEFVIRDKAGNETVIPVTVDWIAIPAENVEVYLEYSLTELTNKDVVVTLVNPTNNVKIINNEGKNTYTFTENGLFTFQYEDDLGEVGSITAIVDYIDKIAPTGSVTFSTEEETKGPVTAYLTVDEDVTIINNNGKEIYIVYENGTYEFVIRDKAGNESKIKFTITWIVKDNPPVIEDPTKPEIPDDDNTPTDDEANLPVEEEVKPKPTVTEEEIPHNSTSTSNTSSTTTTTTTTRPTTTTTTKEVVSTTTTVEAEEKEEIEMPKLKEEVTKNRNKVIAFIVSITVFVSGVALLIFKKSGK